MSQRRIWRNTLGKGILQSSVIGRSGAEGLFESELKGQNGCRIYIVDAEGNTKEELADRLVEHGKTIKLTIDSELQRVLYEQFREDKSCSVAMNPYTGGVFALVSTPSYDNNDFIMIQPYFVYRPDAEPEYWIHNAFSENTTNLVL